MILAREPILNAIPIAKLRPTQITVGMREVEEKRAFRRTFDAAICPIARTAPDWRSASRERTLIFTQRSHLFQNCVTGFASASMNRSGTRAVRALFSFAK